METKKIFKLNIICGCFISLWLKGDAINSLVFSSWTDPEKLATMAKYTESTVHLTFFSLSSTPQITSIASDAENQALFLYGPTNRVIYKMSNFSGYFNETYKIRVTALKSGVSSVISNLAFDWIAGNLYWTDSAYDWIVMMSTLASDQSMYRIIIQHDLHRPEAIAVDPFAGYLFWTDTSVNYRLERSTLAGGDRKIILQSSMLRVLSMVADTSNQKLFWVDNTRQTIESSSYNGSNRRVLIRKNSVSLKSISLDGNDLYATQTSYIFSYDKVSGLPKRSYNVSDPFAVHVYRTDRGSSTSACSTASCSHICANTPSGPVCVCKEGYQLDSNNRTCSSKTGFYERGVLFTDGVAICMLNLESLTGLSLPYHCRNMTVLSVGAITSDRTHLIYYDKIDNSIKSVPFANLASSQTLLSAVGAVKKMIYDWRDNILFWIDNSTSSIKAYDVRSSSSVVQLYTNLSDPDSLTIDPHEKSIYWIEGLSGSRRIMKGRMSPSSMGDLLTLVNSGSLSSPTGLFFDYIKRSLYFIDGGVLKSVSKDGSHTGTYGAVGTGIILAVYNDYAVWTDGSRVLSTKTLDLLSYPRSLTMSTISTIIDMTIHDSNIMQELGPCTILNGGCEHICLPDTSGPVCVCDHGFTLQSDNKTCSSTPMEDQFAIVNDYTHDKIYQISTDGQMIKALDIPGISRSACAIFNPLNRKVYYAEISTSQIKSASLYGTNRSTIYSPSTTKPDRLAIDFSTGNLYYTAFSAVQGVNYGSIGVIRLDTLVHKQIVTGLSIPRAIALHPSQGYIFWTDHGNIPHIGRSFMDGTSNTSIANSNMKWPNGLAIDYTADRIYWTDGYYDRIESCDLSGGDRLKLMDDAHAHLVDIIIRGAYIYYTAWNRQKVTKVDKSSGTIMSWMQDIPEFGRLDSIDFYPADNQPENAICKSRNGECSTFCFARPQDVVVCGCQDFVTLLSDRKTCSDVTVCPESIQNGRVESNCLRYQGESCNFTCNNGYEPKYGVSNIQCDQLGRWNYDSVCEAIKCPSSFPNGNVPESCNRKVGSQCAYQCNSGFRENSDITYLTCLTSGNWDRDLASLCTSTLVTCPSSISNGNLSKACTAVAGAHCFFTCNEGYKKKEGLTSLNCSSNGQWNTDPNNVCIRILVTCPSSIANGNLSQACTAVAGAQCFFTCNEGYKKKEGVTSLNCSSNGQWNADSNNICISTLVTCPSLISNGNLSQTCTAVAGAQCLITCNEGYRKKEGVESLRCLSNGQWNTDSNSVCIKNGQCTVVIPRGKLDKCLPLFGEQCRYTCDKGYKKKNEMITFITCLNSGQWDRSEDTLCVEANEGTLVICPSSISNGNLSKACTAVAGAQCFFTCNEGYRKKEGVTSLNCSSNGQWNTDSNNVCIKNGQCTGVIPRGKLNTCQPLFGEQCRYTCDKGYKKKNEMVTFITCLNSGQWDRSEDTLCVEANEGTSESRSAESKSRSNKAAIAGGSVGGVLLLIVIIVIAAILYIRHRNHSIYKDKTEGDTSHLFNVPGTVYEESR